MSSPTKVQWSEEQRMRIAGECMAKLLRIGMSDSELKDAADLTWAAVKALEIARNRTMAHHLGPMT